MDVVDQLRKIVGGDILVSGDAKRFARDKSSFHGSVPIAVVRPRNVNQVSRIMKLCNSSNLHVTVRGGGSSLTGASVPGRGGIVIDMSKFNRILETKVEDRYVVA